jgi:putative transposase
MKSITTKHGSSQPATDTAVYLFDDWFVVRDRVRGFIQAMIEGELDGTLERPPIWPPPAIIEQRQRW